MTSEDLPSRSFPLVPHELGRVTLKCRSCKRTIPHGYPFVPVFADLRGSQEMAAVVCVYCEDLTASA